jgi:hypothetical protein
MIIEEWPLNKNLLQMTGILQWMPDTTIYDNDWHSGKSLTLRYAYSMIYSTLIQCVLCENGHSEWNRDYDK